MHSDSGPQSSADVLLVASHPPDLAGMRPHLSERLDGLFRNVRVRSKFVGFGMVAAGASTARGILAVRPRAVILVGTCGVYPGLPRYRPHDVVVPARAHLLSHAALAARAAYPEPMQTSVECHALLGAALQQSHGRAFVAPVASPLASTIDDTLAAAVPRGTSWEAENLEAFGVASACRAADVPFSAVLGVSHVIGSSGRHDWAQFQRDAVSSAAGAVAAWLHNGAQGLAHG